MLVYNDGILIDVNKEKFEKAKLQVLRAFLYVGMEQPNIKLPNQDMFNGLITLRYYDEISFKGLQKAVKLLC